MKAKKTLIAMAVVLIAIFAVGVGVKAKLESGLKELAKTDIAEVDLGSIAGRRVCGISQRISRGRRAKGEGGRS